MEEDSADIATDAVGDTPKKNQITKRLTRLLLLHKLSSIWIWEYSTLVFYAHSLQLLHQRVRWPQRNTRNEKNS